MGLGSTKILLIDDDIEMREMLQDYLAQKGAEVHGFNRAQEALLFVDNNDLADQLDVVITDLKMPGMDGIELSKVFHQKYPEIPIILITAHASIDSAIESTKIGVYSYLAKPLKLNELESLLTKAIQFRRLKKEVKVLKLEQKDKWVYSGIVGKSKAMQNIFALIERIASAKSNVLIQGESGTGKELIAKAIHNRGARKDKPFVAINCSSIPANLLESELFGHIKGSFTGAVQNRMGLFEEANGGTLFLDEIGDLELHLQAKLLRVLQEKSIKPVGSNQMKDVDVRIVAATHKNLKDEIKKGTFREDLFYRLSVIPIHIPPLNEREEDIPLLTNYFLNKYVSLNDSQVRGIESNAMKNLVTRHWEGNVRELENLIERLVVLCATDYIDITDLENLEADNVEDVFVKLASDLPSLEDLENKYISFVLSKCGGKKEKAANILGINRRTLYRKEQEGIIGSYDQ